MNGARYSRLTRETPRAMQRSLQGERGPQMARYDHPVRLRALRSREEGAAWEGGNLLYEASQPSQGYPGSAFYAAFL